jgi:hypothetical protein
VDTRYAGTKEETGGNRVDLPTFTLSELTAVKNQIAEWDTAGLPLLS